LTITLGILAFTRCLIEERGIDIDSGVQIHELSELLGGEMDCWSFVTSTIQETGELGIIVATEPREALMKRMHRAQETLYILIHICRVFQVWEATLD